MSRQDVKYTVSFTYTERDWEGVIDCLLKGAETRGSAWLDWAEGVADRVKNIVAEEKAKQAQADNYNLSCYEYDGYDEQLDLRDIFPNHEDVSDDDLWDML